MSLSIKSIRIDGFRGYEHLSLDDLRHLVVLVGANAVGKTNVVEAIQLLTSGESFRKPGWDEVVSWERDFACVKGTFTDERRNIEHLMVVKDGKRTYEVNGKKKPASAIRGTCPSVLFIPDHLQMVKASSAARRDALDGLGSQLSKNYGALKQDYAQALKQRNLLIRNEVHDGPLFESWDDSLAVNGARLCINRFRLFSRLAQHMQEIYPRLVEGETLQARYIPSWSRFEEDGRQRGDFSQLSLVPEEEITLESAEEMIASGCKKLAEMEMRRKTSLIGPHKDEIGIFIDGRNARQFASQGQQRTVVLAWKLAEVSLVREFLGQNPVLLLDDVMSELDGKRRDALTEFIEGSAQTIITTTNLGYFSEELLNQAQVIHLPIEGTKVNYQEG